MGGYAGVQCVRGAVQRPAGGLLRTDAVGVLCRGVSRSVQPLLCAGGWDSGPHPVCIPDNGDMPPAYQCAERGITISIPGDRALNPPAFTLREDKIPGQSLRKRSTHNLGIRYHDYCLPTAITRSIVGSPWTTHPVRGHRCVSCCCARRKTRHASPGDR